jgi:hypothetical protein
MLEQVGNAVTFVGWFTAAKVGVPGLTVTCDVYRLGAGIIVTGASASAVGGGLYSYTLASGSTGTPDDYYAIFKTTDATVDMKHTPSMWAVGKAGIENLDATISSRLASAGYTAPPSAAANADAVWDEALSGHAVAGSAGASLSAAGASGDPLLNAVPGTYLSGTAGHALGRIGSANVTVVAPVSADGTVLTLVRGDDYAAADGRALDFLAPTAGWPNLTAATIAITVRKPDDSILLADSGSVVTPTGASAKVRVELSSADTEILVPGCRFDVEATLSSSRIVTLVEGTVVVVSDQTRHP